MVSFLFFLYFFVSFFTFLMEETDRGKEELQEGQLTATLKRRSLRIRKRDQQSSSSSVCVSIRVPELTYKKYERSKILVTSCISKVDRIGMRVNRMFCLRKSTGGKCGRQITVVSSEEQNK